MPGSSRKLALPFGDTVLPAPSAGSPSVPAASPASRCHDRSRLWLCLYLPLLPLEVCACRAGAPLAILETAKKKPAILLCNDAAARCGVKAGMPANAALALAPDLELRERDGARERAALEELAGWATRFTPLVSPDPGGAALLLEIGASIGLFGGIDKLKATATQGVRKRGHAALSTVAPTARAALWLAQAGEETTVIGPEQLAGALARLPLEATGWPRSVLHRLHRMGAVRLGDCMRLPRVGLARRGGARCVAEMDEALGRSPELRPAWREDARFSDELELPAETRETGILVNPLRILLERLERHLRIRQAGARILWLRLHHRAAPPTLLRIGLLRPGTDARHFEELAAIHLDAVGLPAPVTAISLEADVAEAPGDAARDLWGREPDPERRVAGLLERLRARLGPHAVHGLRRGNEHRPERAWETVQEPVVRRCRKDEEAAGVRGRPAWMLEPPAPLDIGSGAPLFDGPLRLESGPERIETGWWDGQDVRRDYYVARNAKGMRVWVFNDLRSGNWYLHGLFG